MSMSDLPTLNHRQLSSVNEMSLHLIVHVLDRRNKNRQGDPGVVTRQESL